MFIIFWPPNSLASFDHGPFMHAAPVERLCLLHSLMRSDRLGATEDAQGEKDDDSRLSKSFAKDEPHMFSDSSAPTHPCSGNWAKRVFGCLGKGSFWNAEGYSKAFGNYLGFSFGQSGGASNNALNDLVQGPRIQELFDQRATRRHFIFY